VPEPLREATRRNAFFEEARVAVAKNDLATAHAKAAEYARLVAARKTPFELRQQHEIAGLIAIAEKQPAAAVKELEQANQQDPRILYLTSVALSDAGDTARATTLRTKAATFNGLAFNYAYVRGKARKATGTM
jgi:hypothetical protein